MSLDCGKKLEKGCKLSWFIVLYALAWRRTFKVVKFENNHRYSQMLFSILLIGILWMVCRTHLVCRSLLNDKHNSAPREFYTIHFELGASVWGFLDISSSFWRLKRAFLFPNTWNTSHKIHEISQSLFRWPNYLWNLRDHSEIEGAVGRSLFLQLCNHWSVSNRVERLAVDLFICPHIWIIKASLWLADREKMAYCRSKLQQHYSCVT